MEKDTEKQFLETYDASVYPRPSVTTDIVIFTITDTGKLGILLIRRGGHPFKDKWALPGGFLNAGRESADETALRELREETGVSNAFLKQLYTFSRPDRDPRTHVISIAYTALVPMGSLRIKAGDDASDARLFTVERIDGKLSFTSDLFSISEDDLSFDHAEIIRIALIRLQNRLTYEPDAFELLADKKRFTIYELKRIFEVILGKHLDTPNFRKLFQRNYVDSGMVRKTGAVKKSSGHRPAALYEWIERGF